MLHFGDTFSVTHIRQRRINVTNDDELASALERVQSHFRGKPVAAIVRELALRGASTLEVEEERHAPARRPF